MSVNTKLTLSVKSGPGDIVGVTEIQSINGRADFNGIQFTEAGSYILTITPDNINVESAEVEINVSPEEDFIPQDNPIEQSEEGEEEQEALEGSRPIISQIKEPTLDLKAMQFDASPNEGDNSELLTSLGFTPFLWYNGVQMRVSDIKSLYLYYENNIPRCRAIIIDTLGFIGTQDSMPLNDTKFELFINSGSDILKSIHLRFKMQFNQENKKNGTYTITGTLDVDNFYKKGYKSYKGTSFNVLKELAVENGIGFNSNIGNTNDTMTWRKNGSNIPEFVKNVVKHSYISDNSFILGYYDYYWCYNCIDIEKEWNRDIKNDLGLNTQGLSSLDSNMELTPLVLTNDASSDASGFYFNKYRFRNNSTYQTTNSGIYTISRVYDRSTKQFLKFDIDSLNSDNSDNIILKGRPNDTEELKQSYNTDYGGKIDTDNIHQNYMYALSQNERNVKNLHNISIELDMPQPNFNVYRYQKIRVNFINQKQTPINTVVVNERLTGEWLITDISFVWKRGTLTQKLTIVRKELGKTLKEKETQQTEDTAENNSEINENPLDNLQTEGLELQEEQNDDFIFSGGTFTEGEEFTEREFQGEEESELTIPPEDQRLYETESNQINNSPTPISEGNYNIDFIEGSYVDNQGNDIEVCQIDGSAINVKVVGKYLDMKEAARSDGILLSVNSGFRSPINTINTKSNNGVLVRASSQKYLYDNWVARKPGFNLAAKPYTSKHGNGISLDLNTGSRTKNTLNESLYSWLIKNSWKYGFVRSVRSEEWHFDYLPNLINSSQGGPYSKLAANDSNLFFSDLGLDRLS
jgi:hypothetical protein